MPLLKGQAVSQLLSIDPSRAIRLLIDFHEEIPPGIVVPAIQVKIRMHSLIGCCRIELTLQDSSKMKRFTLNHEGQVDFPAPFQGPTVVHLA